MADFDEVTRKGIERRRFRQPIIEHAERLGLPIMLAYTVIEDQEFFAHGL